MTPEKMYSCPMHPSIVQKSPGMCPECGMKLVLTKNKKTGSLGGAHDSHRGHETGLFLKKFWITLILTLPILGYAEIFEIAFGATLPSFPGQKLLILLLGSAVFFYGGWVFISSSLREIRARLPGMMTLVSLAITSAYIFSVFQFIRGEPHDLFWELSTLIVVMLLGHWIEMRAVQGAKGALKELAKLLPDHALVVRGKDQVEVPLSELRVGDLVLVKPGAKVPADGEVVAGESQIDESILTGESAPVSKTLGSSVIAGSINGDGSITVKITKIGEHTFLAGVERLVAEAEASKSRLQTLSDKAALYLTGIAIVSGGITFVAWILVHAEIAFAAERLVAVLVIACPHALGLAVPLVASISTTIASRNGFLVRNRLALEAARNIDIVLFDKTGTLTKGEFGVYAIVTAPQKEEEVLRYAASVNILSEHPLAKAMVNETKNRKISLLEAKNFTRLPGQGVRGVVGRNTILIGNDSLLAEAKIVPSKKYTQRLATLAREGKTVNHVLLNGSLIGSVALADVIREESREAVRALSSLGIEVAMITGDSEEVAQWVSKEIGIKKYFAKILPEEKAGIVKKLQGGATSNRKFVAMVGDGVNDAPALAQSDIGIAIGAGTNVAIESAGIILVRNDPRDIPKIIRLSRLTYSKMRQNLFWATGYNIAALPLAAGVLASKGILLEPALAAIFMSFSTVIVAINALLLRKQAL